MYIGSSSILSMFFVEYNLKIKGSARYDQNNKIKNKEIMKLSSVARSLEISLHCTQTLLVEIIKEIESYVTNLNFLISIIYIFAT